MDHSLLEKIISLLDGKMATPKTLGVFHIVSVAVLIALCVLAVRYRKIFTEKRTPFVILGVGITMTLFEIYKQLVMSYDFTSDVWSYRWFIFPFQFCSTPIYITLLAFAFSRLKNKLLYESLTSFLATYCMIAGIVVFSVPSSVFNELVGVNIQTVVHHGLMIILAVCLLASGTVKPDVTSLKKAFVVFLPLLVAALIMNTIYGNGAEFDMFYLAPDSTFVLKRLRELLWGFPPYPVYLIGYVALFTLGSFLVLFITKRIKEAKSSK